MRRFLYYDKEGIESYLAQITGGIQINTSQEVTKENGKRVTKENKKSVNSDIGAKLAGFGAELQEKVTKGEINDHISSELVKSLEEKVMSDYAFDKVYEFFVNKNLIKINDFEIGDIIHLSENVTFIDFDYFEKIFSENGPYLFSIKQQKKELKKLKDNMTSEERKNINIKIELNKTEENLKNYEDTRKELLDIVEVVKNTLPYAKFLLTKECLIVLSDYNFRDDSNSIAFKYGGKIDIVGFVTNTINDDESLPNENSFSEIYNIINKILLNLFNNKTRIYVVHPLVMYY